MMRKIMTLKPVFSMTSMQRSNVTVDLIGRHSFYLSKSINAFLPSVKFAIGASHIPSAATSRTLFKICHIFISLLVIQPN